MTCLPARTPLTSSASAIRSFQADYKPRKGANHVRETQFRSSTPLATAANSSQALAGRPVDGQPIRLCPGLAAGDRLPDRRTPLASDPPVPIDTPADVSTALIRLCNPPSIRRRRSRLCTSRMLFKLRTMTARPWRGLVFRHDHGRGGGGRVRVAADGHVASIHMSQLNLNFETHESTSPSGAPPMRFARWTLSSKSLTVCSCCGGRSTPTTPR